MSLPEDAATKPNLPKRASIADIFEYQLPAGFPPVQAFLDSNAPTYFIDGTRKGQMNGVFRCLDQDVVGSVEDVDGIATIVGHFFPDGLFMASRMQDGVKTGEYHFINGGPGVYTTSDTFKVTPVLARITPVPAHDKDIKGNQRRMLHDLHTLEDVEQETRSYQ